LQVIISYNPVDIDQHLIIFEYSIPVLANIDNIQILTFIQCVLQFNIPGVGATGVHCGRYLFYTHNFHTLLN